MPVEVDQDAPDFTLKDLSDFWPHGRVSRAYGVFNEALGCANRATFVIDKEGKVVDAFESPNLGTPRDMAAYDAALARLT
jgi:peroxiredoxin (alkyl hydroperoxide reductase subunit C)